MFDDFLSHDNPEFYGPARIDMARKSLALQMTSIDRLVYAQHLVITFKYQSTSTVNPACNVLRC